MKNFPYALLCLISVYVISSKAQKNVHANIEKIDSVSEFVKARVEILENTSNDVLRREIILDTPSTVFCNKTNTNKIKLYKNSDDFLYLLSSNELIAIDVNDNKQIQLHFVGTLEEVDKEVSEIHVRNWKNMIVIVLRFTDSLHIYLAKRDFHKSITMRPIQKMNVTSEKIAFFNKRDELFLIVYTHGSANLNQLSLFKWKTSFFSLEFRETIELATKSDLFIFEENKTGPLVLFIGASNTTKVAIFKLESPQNQWTKLHALHFKQSYTAHYVFEDNLYLIGCSTKSFCAIYKFTDGQFRRNLKIKSQLAENIKSIYYQHDIVVLKNRDNKVNLFSNDDVLNSRPGISLSELPAIVEYAIYQPSSLHQRFFVEFIFDQAQHIIIKFHPMSVMKRPEGKSVELRENDTEECVKKLKMLLKSRIPQVQTSRLLAEKLAKRDRDIKIDNKKILEARLTTLKSSDVGRIKIPYKIKMPSSRLQDQIANVNVLVAQNQAMLRKPQRPMIQGRADDQFKDGLDRIIIKNLVHMPDENLATGILLKTQSPITFTDQIKIRNVTGSKVVVNENKINEIPLNELLNSTSTKTVLGNKVFRRITADNLSIPTLNNVELDFLQADISGIKLSKGFEFLGNLKVKDLVVNNTNGVSFESIARNAFISKKQNVLEGNLIVTRDTSVTDLVTKVLMHLPMMNVMTKSTDQTINGKLFISKFFVSKLTSNTTNGEQLGKNAALVNASNRIDIPTQFLNLNIFNNLNISENEDSEQRTSLSRSIESMKHHIIGTRSSDLSQIYNGVVTVKGSLILSDVSTLLPNTKLILNDQVVPKNITNNFWMKSTQQNVQVENFVIKNQATKTGNVFTKFVNGEHVQKFVLLNSGEIPSNVNIRFQKAIVNGDVKTQKTKIPSLLSYLSSVAVPLKGPPVILESSIDFRNKLAARKLEVNKISNVSAATLISASQQRIVLGDLKSLETLRALSANVEGGLVINNINNINVEKIASEAIRINKPLSLKELKVESFSAVDLRANFFEDRLLDDFMEYLDKHLRQGDTNFKRTIDNVRIGGNANFMTNVALGSLQGEKPFNELIAMLVTTNGAVTDVGGRKTFLKSVTSKNFFDSKLVNGFFLPRLLHQSLSRNEKQNVTGELFVKHLSIKKLRFKNLNGIGWHQLVDKRKLNLPLKVNLNVKELSALSLTSRFSTYDIEHLEQMVRYPQCTNLKLLQVAKHTELTSKPPLHLDRMISYAVYKIGDTQIISGPVRVVSPEVFIKKIWKLDGNFIVSSLNVVNMLELFLDSLKNGSSTCQVINGISSFSSSIYAKNVFIETGAFFASNQINDVNPMTLNDTIVRKKTIIAKRKNFNYLHVHDIELRGRINEVVPKDLLSTVTATYPFTKMNITDVETTVLKIKTFSDYSYSHFLMSRLHRWGIAGQEANGIVVFNSMNIVGDSLMNLINNVFIDDVVYSKSDQMQDIQGLKIINGNLTLRGPSTVKTINNVDFSDFLKNTFTRDQKRYIDTLQLSSANFKNGISARYQMNSNKIKDLLASDAHVPQVRSMNALFDNIENGIEETSTDKRAAPKRLLYVDVNKDPQLSFNVQRSSNNSGCSADDEWKTELPGVKISIKPNFECKRIDRQLEVTWSIKNKSHQKSFIFANVISDVKFVQSKKIEILMVVIIQSPTNETSEINVFKLVNDEWIAVQTELKLNRIITSKIIETLHHHFFIVSSSEFVSVLQLDEVSNKFEMSQHRLVAGEFRKILHLNVSPKSGISRPKTFLLLKEDRSSAIHIYQLNSPSSKFVLQRKLQFENEIVEVVMLYIVDSPHFVVSLLTGDFCLFELRGIESWKMKQCGHFNNVKQIKTHEYFKRQHIVLSSAKEKTALTVYRQGEIF